MCFAAYEVGKIHVLQKSSILHLSMSNVIADKSHNVNVSFCILYIIDSLLRICSLHLPKPTLLSDQGAHCRIFSFRISLDYT